jgi:hypothetical protein
MRLGQIPGTAAVSLNLEDFAPVVTDPTPSAPFLRTKQRFLSR